MVVLFALAVLAVLFSTASTRTLAGLQFNAAERAAAARTEARIALLDALMLRGRPDADQVVWDGRVARLQPTAGLVDLNAASPELLERLLIGYDLTAPERAAALLSYRTWRRQGLRLQRVADFARVSDLDPARLPGLAALATVHSGRATLAAEQAPLAVLAHLTGQQGDRDTLIGLLPPALLGPGNDAVFAVFEGDQRLGVVSFGSTAAQNRIIALN